MGASDALLARLQTESEERQKFMDGVVEDAQKEERDLSEQELGLLARTRDRLKELGEQIEQVGSVVQIAERSRARTAEIAEQFRVARDPAAAKAIEYRSVGEYIIERWRAGLGNTEAGERLDLFHRAAAHQTTADNPGLLPAPIIAPVVN